MTELEARFLRETQRSSDMQLHMHTLALYAWRCRSIAEFGVDDCTSTWALLSGRPAKMRSYDINRREQVAEVENVTAATVGVDFQFIQKSTLEIELPPCDLLFVDSLHTYDQVRQELALHGNKINRYILFHDTALFAIQDQDNPNGRGIVAAIDEFVAANPHWQRIAKYDYGFGLTILERAT